MPVPPGLATDPREHRTRGSQTPESTDSTGDHWKHREVSTEQGNSEAMMTTRDEPVSKIPQGRWYLGTNSCNIHKQRREESNPVQLVFRELFDYHIRQNRIIALHLPVRWLLGGRDDVPVLSIFSKFSIRVTVGVSFSKLLLTSWD